jgi:hypothetical protein
LSWRRGLSFGDTLPQYLADAKTPHAEQDSSSFLVDCVIDNLPGDEFRHGSYTCVMGEYQSTPNPGRRY